VGSALNRQLKPRSPRPHRAGIDGCGRLSWDRFEFSEKPNDRSAGVVAECEHVDQVGEAGGLISWVI
jgi:hypothetical protein